MDYEESVADLFRELDGLELLANRLVVPCIFIFFLLFQNELENKRDEKNPSTEQQLGLKLIKVLLRALIPCIQGRVPPQVQSALLVGLSKIFANHKQYGASIFSLAESTLAALLQAIRIVYSSNVNRMTLQVSQQ